MSDDAASDVQPRKSKKTLIGVLAGITLLAAGAGSYLAFGSKGTDTAEEAPAEAKLPPQFVVLDPPFVVNFQPGSPARFLQVAVQVMTRDPALVATLEHLSPIIRNDLLVLFGNKSVSEVATPEGKEALRAATLEAVRKVVAAENGNADALEAVYFTSFVMQ